MSFTSNVKNEISKLEITDIDVIAELSALLKTTSTISDKIKVSTENASVARRIFNLVKRKYQVTPKITIRRGFNFNKSYIYILEIKNKIDYIIEDLNIKKSIPDLYIIDDEESKRAYIRGLFMGSGSINDPSKSRYHLEFFVNDKYYANFVSTLLNNFRLNSKIIKKDNKYMVYVKEAEKIGDFLRIINATESLFYFEDIRIYRDHKNMTNRLNNCEQANINKIIETANNQVKDIELIKSIGGLDLLDEKTKEAAIYRLKYPEESLLDLSLIISLETGNEITKSGLHHRFDKIKKLANNIRNKNN